MIWKAKRGNISEAEFGGCRSALNRTYFCNEHASYVEIPDRRPEKNSNGFHVSAPRFIGNEINKKRAKLLALYHT